jgi:hypothetical protein
VLPALPVFISGAALDLADCQSQRFDCKPGV